MWEPSLSSQMTEYGIAISEEAVDVRNRPAARSPCRTPKIGSARWVVPHKSMTHEAEKRMR